MDNTDFNNTHMTREEINETENFNDPNDPPHETSGNGWFEGEYEPRETQLENIKNGY
jgi:hypothetical protein